MHLNNKRIILTKTNQIGDVSFALPIASVLKNHYPDCAIIFIGRGYTRALIDQYADVDEFVDWDVLSKLPRDQAIKALQALQADVIVHVQPNKQLAQLAKQATIKLRIGNSRRLFHWWTCNRLVTVIRKNSPLHETQMDMHYLKAFHLKSDYSLDEIIALRHFKPFQKTADCLALLDPKRFNLILHPKTRGQHIEWPAAHFAQLISLLPKDQFKIFISGSAEEAEAIRDTMVQPFPEVIDLTGKTSLADLTQLIAAADGLIAASTGPVHLAANYGVRTLGLYAPIKPFDASRWGPVGAQAEVLARTPSCSDCRITGPCHCIAQITVAEVFAVLRRWQSDYLPSLKNVGH